MKKNFFKLSALAAVLVASATFASADTLQLGSYVGAVTLGNVNTAINYAGYSAVSSAPTSGTGTSFALSANGVWAPALPNSTYVGAFADAGPGGNNPASGYYTFTTTFTTASAGPYTGSITVLADDTTKVLLNGVTLISFGALGTNVKCADNVPNCTTIDTVSISQILLGGVNANTLTFVVQQAGDQAPKLDPSGFDFSATLSASAVPEPSSLLMLGTGLVGSAGMLFRRMRS